MTKFEKYDLQDLCLRVQADYPDCNDPDQLRELLISTIKKDFWKSGDAGYLFECIEEAATVIIQKMKPKLN